MTTGLILLAAGGSARLGRPKQLLSYRGRTLLRHAAETACDSKCRPIVIVLGAQAKHLSSELIGLDVGIAENPEWQLGLGSSIRAGLSALEVKDGELSGVVLMLCDQPFLTADFLNRLTDSHQASHSLIVAAEYASTRGVPAFFHRSLFPELLALPPEQGAKPIILRHASETTALPLSVGTIDIDTEADYAKLLKACSNSPGTFRKKSND